MLRTMGKDIYLLTGDVVHCLKHAGLEIADTPNSKRDALLIQQAFNQWHEESGLPYSHISRICSFSVGENYSIEQLSN
jgi:hypothetical protein